MIPKVIEGPRRAGTADRNGRSMVGLIRYLVGPGSANEHTNPHVVAASGFIQAAFAESDWKGTEARDLARKLDSAWRTKRPAAGDELRGHVFHVALSVGTDDGELGDASWSAIANEYVTAMGFTNSEGKADCEWAAIHHGRSVKGNDHIHLAVCLVRSDGTWASTWQSKRRSQEIARDIEKRHGLRPLADKPGERGIPGLTGGEIAKARRLGTEPNRDALRRVVRATAAGASTEAEFVQQLRRNGVLVRARFEKGSRDAAVGYSVALRPAKGTSPVWYGGGRLARDLTLPTLRQSWSTSAADASEAVAQWSAASGARRPPGGRGRGDRQPAPTAPGWWSKAASDLAQINAQLATTDPANRPAWRHAAGQAAAVLAAWSVRTEGTNSGPLGRASDALARSAQAAEEPPADIGGGTVDAAIAVRMLARAGGRRDAAGWLAVLDQVMQTTRAIAEAHTARDEAIRSEALLRVAEQDLAQLRDELARAAEERSAREAAADKDRTRTGQAAGADRTLTRDQQVPTRGTEQETDYGR